MKKGIFRGSDVVFLKCVLKNLSLSLIFSLYCYVFENEFFSGFLIYLGILNIIALSLIHKGLYFSWVSNRNSNIDNKVLFLNYDSQNNIYYSDNVERYWRFLQIVLMGLEKDNKKQVQDFKSKNFRIVIGCREELKCLNKLVGKRYDRINGQFQTKNKFIIVYVDDIMGKEIDFNTFLAVFYHEWGHFVDYRLNFVSKTIYFKKEFQLFMNKILIRRISFMKNKKKMNLFQILKCKSKERKLFYEFKDESEFFAHVYSLFKRTDKSENCFYPQEIMDYIRWVDVM